MSLTAEQFPDFFQAIWGLRPFPWQQRLAHRVITEGWPAVLDLPTGSGKTAVIDIAVFAMAVDAARPPDQRTAPRRVVMVVDRRVVVDQGHERATALARALADTADPIVVAVAEALRGLSSDDRPLDTAILRGGIPRSDEWARSPDQPLVAVSTVDQVGSRLLFRGYGVSRSMRPVHAGLLGNDTLFLLDEVHLSQPFAQTLRALAGLQPVGPTLPHRTAVVEMSATPMDHDGGQTFTLAHDDRDHPVLASRLAARKPARLVPVKVSKRAGPAAAHDALARATDDAIGPLLEQGARVIGAVFNRVDSARAAATTLRKRKDTDVLLLTGRMRPYDRDALLDVYLPRIRAGRQRDPDARPLIVVATQCIEAGADLDFDALVTECASIDALRQRFGRLNRLGALPHSPAVILCRTDQVGSKPPTDPIYGDALAATWAWLQGLDAVDLGVDAWVQPDADTLPRLRAPALHAPVLLPSHIATWTHTRPVPAADPDVSLWLHGPRRVAADVQICWRADVDIDALASPDDHDDLLARLAFAPPGSGETISLSLRALRAWLTATPGPDLADVDGAIDDGEHRRPTAASASRGTDVPLVLIWRGERSEVAHIDRVRPGDTVVLPASIGGIAHGNWDPTASDPVVDLGDRVQAQQRGRITLRLHPDLLRGWLPAEALAGLPTPPWPDDADEGLADAVTRWAAAARSGSVPPGSEPSGSGGSGASTAPDSWLSAALDVASSGQITLVELANSYGVVARRRRGGRTREVSTEDDSASFTARQVPLDEHCGRVRDRARRHAQAAGLPPRIVDDLALAGWLHDIGKADPRFQLMLVGGDPVLEAMLERPLAKSPLPMQDLGARRRAQRRAGYPPGTRHELLSVALIDGGNALATAHDPDLVRHLVGSHHGWCRPFAPAVADPNPMPVTLTHGGEPLAASTDHDLAALDSGIIDRFWALNRRYGPWGLAWLEALLRLADHAVSAAEQEA